MSEGKWQARCGNCGAPIRWVLSHRSKADMAIDAEPNVNGSLYLYEDDAGETWARETKEPPSPMFPQERFTSHAATCEARRW